MKKITTLLCGVAMAAALAAPVHAGGKSTTGSSTTVPASVVAALNYYFNDRVSNVEIMPNGHYIVTDEHGIQMEVHSQFVALLLSSF